jgi:hypothetical protein
MVKKRQGSGEHILLQAKGTMEQNKLRIFWHFNSKAFSYLIQNIVIK